MLVNFHLDLPFSNLSLSNWKIGNFLMFYTTKRSHRALKHQIPAQSR